MSQVVGKPRIVADGLTKYFGTQRVLSGAALTAPAGTLTVVLGDPGVGKSTLARCLTGVYLPDAGSVRYCLGESAAVELTSMDARTAAWIRTHHIASFDDLMAAAPRLPAASAAARNARRERAAAVGMFTRFGVADLATVPVGRLRPAERLTVALMAALIADRPFVVLDSPERCADPGVLTAWLRRLTDRGVAVVATGGPDSRLVAAAASVGELMRGRIEWHRRC